MKYSVQSLDRLDRQEDIKDDSAEILLKFFPQKATVSSSGMGRGVHSLMLCIQHILCRPRRCPPSSVDEGWRMKDEGWRMKNEGWRMKDGRTTNEGSRQAVVACHMPKPCKFPCLGSCQKTFLWTHKELILLRTQLLVLCFKWEMQRSFLRHLVSNT